MVEQLFILFFLLVVNISSGYYVYMIFRRPDQYRIKVEGWGFSNPLLPRSIAYSTGYLWFNKIGHIIIFLTTSLFISVLILDLLRII